MSKPKKRVSDIVFVLLKRERRNDKIIKAIHARPLLTVKHNIYLVGTKFNNILNGEKIYIIMTKYKLENNKII